MAVNDEIWNNLAQYGGGSINERVYNYLGSLGYTGSINDRLGGFSSEGRNGWQGLIRAWGQWAPAQLFSQGQQGVWYEPKPVINGQQILYQDSVGTTPVTADGQPVGYMQDLSGNGNHATQSTSAARPIYRTDGVLHWLAFDGVDDTLDTGLVMGGATGRRSGALAYRLNDPLTVTQYVFADAAADQAFAVLALNGGSTRYLLKGALTDIDTVTGPTALHVVSDFDAGIGEVIANGSISPLNVGTATSSDTLRLFSRPGGVYASGDLYAAVFLSDSSRDLDGDLYDYVKQKIEDVS